MNRALWEPGVDCRNGAAEPIRLGDQFQRFGFNLVGERFNRPTSTEWINGSNDTRLMRKDLLCSQRETRRLFCW